MINNNLNLVRTSVSKVSSSFQSGAAAARDEMMTSLIQLTKEMIVGERGYVQTGKSRTYDVATPDLPPMNRTGTLRRSIQGQKYDLADGKYGAMVGPGVVYGRALELGGEYAPKKWTRGQKFPYMAPAFRKFQVVAPAIVRKHIG